MKFMSEQLCEKKLVKPKAVLLLASDWSDHTPPAVVVFMYGTSKPSQKDFAFGFK